MLCCPRGAKAQAIDADIVIDGGDVGRQFYGAGAISQGGSTRLLIDYPEPERSRILDYLFKPGYGAALQLLKVGIGGDSNATDGSEPSHMRGPESIDCERGWEWWMMKEARKRNPDIKLVAQEWSAPGWIDGVWSQDNIDYQLAWLGCAEQHGLKIDYIGGWNEKGFDVGWFIAFDQALEENYPYVQIPAADEIGTWQVADSMAANPRFKEAIDFAAVHFVCKWRSHYRHCTSSETAKNLGKPLWLSANSALGWDNGAGPHARALNRMYTGGKMVNYLTWNVAEARYGNLPLGNTGLMGAIWPWSGHYELGKNLWAFAHTTQFTEPGWHYLNTGSGRLGNVSYVSLASPSGDDFSTIIEAMDLGMPRTVSFRLENVPDEDLHLWETDFASDAAADHFRKGRTISPEDGAFQLTLRPDHVYSLTTTTGQGKGLARPEASRHERMDLPFREDFERVEEGKMAPLFSTLNGAFEAAPCAGGRSGKCYQQMVTQQPITWNGSGKMPPTTIIGDPRWWGDYALSADVRLAEPGYVELIGRVSGQLGWTPYLGGYHLRVGTEGWKLYSEDSPTKSRTTIASGTDGMAPGDWHAVSLRMQSDHIDVMLDGEQLASVQSTRQLSGNVALRAGAWNQAQFDDVAVTATGARPGFVASDSLSIARVSSTQDYWGGWTFEAANAVDDRLGTEWQSKSAPWPHSITIDLGGVREIEALWLRPRRPYFDKNNKMNVTGYRVKVSRDGQSFRTVAEGEWPATGSAKLARWDDKVSARFVRLVATNSTTGPASASEIRVITELPSSWDISLQ